MALVSPTLTEKGTPQSYQSHPVSFPLRNTLLFLQEKNLLFLYLSDNITQHRKFIIFLPSIVVTIARSVLGAVFYSVFLHYQGHTGKVNLFQFMGPLGRLERTFLEHCGDRIFFFT